MIENVDEIIPRCTLNCFRYFIETVFSILLLF